MRAGHVFSLVFPLGAKFHQNVKNQIFVKFSLFFKKKSLNFENFFVTVFSQNFSKIIQNLQNNYFFSNIFTTFLSKKWQRLAKENSLIPSSQGEGFLWG
jgi:hypothetical protein